MNFLFLFPDEMCAGSLSCYGNKYSHTPNIDRLAEEGTLFKNCFAQNPVCSPSRCSLMTGTYVHNRGHRTLWHLLQPDEPSLFRYLKKSGYNIQWYGKNDLYSQAYLEEICDDIDEKRRENNSFTRNLAKTGNHFLPGEPGFYSFWYEDVDTEEIPLDDDIKKAISFLQSHQEGDPPFFLYLPLDLPHPPYWAYSIFHKLYQPEQLATELAAPVSGKPGYEALIRKYRNLENLSMESFAEIYSIYLAGCSYVDDLWGKLDQILKETGLNEDTVILFASDHGDWHGTRKLVEKWPNAMDEDLIHVPLIIRMPGGAKGHIVSEPNELFDIMATVLDLAEIQSQHTHFSHSLIPQLLGSPGDRNRLVFCEGGYDITEPHCFEGYPKRESANTSSAIANIYHPKQLQQQLHPESVCRTVMVRNIRYKLVRRSTGEHELYDLENDPGEICNLYSNEISQSVRQELETALLDWYLHTSDTVPSKEDDRNFGS